MSSRRRSLFKQLFEWGRKGTWTIVDQALYAGGNFALNLVLASWMIEAEYGAFAIIFSLFLFVGTVHTGLITEPMLVFGPGRYASRFHQYVAVLFKGHALFSVVFSGLLALAGAGAMLAGSQTIGQSLLSLAICQGFLLLLWFYRRACYVRLKPQVSASGGIVYLAVLGVAAFGLFRADLVTVPAVLAVMAVASLVAALFVRYRLSTGDADAETVPLLAGEVTSEHRAYGSWAVSTGILGLLPSSLPYFVLPFVPTQGLEAAGVLRAVMNFIMPAAHAYAALSLLLVPVFVRAAHRGNINRFILATGALLLVANTSYWALIGFFGEPIMDLLYRGRYVENAGLLWLAGLYPIVSGLAVVTRTALRALERPNIVFYGSLGSSIAALTVGLYLIFTYGLAGAILSTVINVAVDLLVMSRLLFSSPRTIPAVAGDAAA